MIVRLFHAEEEEEEEGDGESLPLATATLSVGTADDATIVLEAANPGVWGKLLNGDN